MSDYPKKPKAIIEMIGIFISFNLVLLCILNINNTYWEFSQNGLISILTHYYWIAVILFMVFYMSTLCSKSTPMVIRMITILLFIIILFGSPTLIEGTPRFGYTFRGGGIADYIVRTGHISVNYSDVGLLSMYQNWPAIFILGAIIHQISEVSISNILLFTPIISQSFYMIPLYFIFNNFFHSDKRRTFFACSLFYAANWINQDFFSSQNIGYFYCYFTLSIFLMMLAKYQDSLTKSPINICAYSFLFILSYAAAVIGHGLSSIATYLYLLGYMTVLSILFKKDKNRSFWSFSRTIKLMLLILVILNFWISYGLSFTLFTKGVNKIGTTSYMNVISHFEKTATLSPEIAGKSDWMPQLKLIYGLLFLLIGIMSLISYLYNMRYDIKSISNPIVLSIVVLASNSVLFITNLYGGEAIIRAYFFSLIVLSFLATLLLNSHHAKHMIIIFLLLSLPAHMLLHYSNEIIYYNPESSLCCINFLYHNSIDGSIILGYDLLDSSTKYEKYIKKPLSLDILEDIESNLSTYVPVYTSITKFDVENMYIYEKILDKNYDKIYSSKQSDKLYYANG